MPAHRKVDRENIAPLSEPHVQTLQRFTSVHGRLQLSDLGIDVECNTGLSNS